MDEKDFPDLPDLTLLKTMANYQERYCNMFEILETSFCDLNTGIAIYFQLCQIANSNETPAEISAILYDYFENTTENSFKNICINDYAKIFCYLSRSNIKRNSLIVSMPFFSFTRLD